MKQNSKVSPVFSNKLSLILTKFKQNTTIHVGHEQARSLFTQFALRDILPAFLSKMDNSEQLSDRQRKEYTKLYMSLLDVYKREILAQPYYEKYLESLSRRTLGVSQAVGHICKNLLNYVEDLQPLCAYVSIIVNVFHTHTQIAKILKQLIDIVDPKVIQSFQTDIIEIVQLRIASSKAKSQFIETVLSLVLRLQHRFSEDIQVSNLLLKYLKNEDWSCRKACVDLSYALLEINQQINPNIHAAVKENKYDKIKHVRDSVNNYEVLHKHIYGEETVSQVEQKIQSLSAIRQAKISQKQSQKVAYKNPLQKDTQKQGRQQRKDHSSNSIDKSTRKKKKNQNFFKNAKNSDVIKVNHAKDRKEESQQQQSPRTETKKLSNIQKNPSERILSQSLDWQNKNNFESYLKNRCAIPSPKKSLVYNTVLQPNRQASLQFQSCNSLKIKNSRVIQPKFNYETELQTFKKKNKMAEVQSINIQNSYKEANLFRANSLGKNNELSMSLIEPHRDNRLIEEIKAMMSQFERKVNSRLDHLENRMDTLQRQFQVVHSSLQISNRSEDVVPVQEAMLMGRLQTNSPRSYLYDQSPNQSGWSYSEAEAIESNLQQKVKASIINQNWDQAFTLALTNSKKGVMLNLLQRCVFPKDKTVEECVLLEIRKLLDYTSTLKWLKYFLIQKNLSYSRLLKLKQLLQRRQSTGNRVYEMMRQLVLNQISDQLQCSQQQH